MNSKERVKRAKNATGRAKTPRKRKIVGRPKLYDRRLILSISAGMIADIDAVSGPRESRADLIRVAIEREIERRIRTHR